MSNNKVSDENGGDDEEEYVIVDKPVEEVVEQEAEVEEAVDDDDRLANESEDIDDEQSQRKLSTSEQNRRRKEKRRQARERDKEEINRLRFENQNLAQRLTGLETNFVRRDAQTIEEQLEQTARDYRSAEDVIAKAVEAGNGQAVAEALRIRDQIMSKANSLSAQKQHIQNYQAPRQAPQQAQPSRPDPLLKRAAEQWMDKNEWYDQNSNEDDALVIRTIDDKLTAEGWDARTEEYWEELDSRASKYLPHRYQRNSSVSQSAPKRKGPPVAGSGREQAPVSTRREVYITPERKQAMEEAGYWEDPDKRKRMLKRYAEQDRNSN
jgi:hypothetical protein